VGVTGVGFLHWRLGRGKEDKGEKADFSGVVILSTHLWIKNLHLPKVVGWDAKFWIKK
jgi:hypothetical protein